MNITPSSLAQYHQAAIEANSTDTEILRMTNTLPKIYKRPLGVSLLVLMNAIDAGVLPLAVLIFAFGENSMGLSIPTITFSGLFSMAILFFCFHTWRGRDTARKALLIMLTLHWGMIILNNLILIFDAPIVATASQQRKLYTNIARSAFSIAINYWYFLGPKPRIFFNNHMKCQ